MTARFVRPISFLDCSRLLIGAASERAASVSRLSEANRMRRSKSDLDTGTVSRTMRAEQDVTHWTRSSLMVCQRARTGARERDGETDKVLEDAGWRVVRIWEHEEPELAALRTRETVTMMRNPQLRRRPQWIRNAPSQSYDAIPSRCP